MSNTPIPIKINCIIIDKKHDTNANFIVQEVMNNKTIYNFDISSIEECEEKKEKYQKFVLLMSKAQQMLCKTVLLLDTAIKSQKDLTSDYGKTIQSFVSDEFLQDILPLLEKLDFSKFELAMAALSACEEDTSLLQMLKFMTDEDLHNRPLDEPITFLQKKGDVEENTEEKDTSNQSNQRFSNEQAVTFLSPISTASEFIQAKHPDSPIPEISVEDLEKDIVVYDFRFPIYFSGKLSLQSSYPAEDIPTLLSEMIGETEEILLLDPTNPHVTLQPGNEFYTGEEYLVHMIMTPEVEIALKDNNNLDIVKWEYTGNPTVPGQIRVVYQRWGELSEYEVNPPNIEEYIINVEQQ